MNLLLNVLLAAVEPDPEFDETLVTPGPEGFTFIVIIAIAAVFLIIDMTRRIRRNTYRGIVQEELIAEAEGSLRSDAQSGVQSTPDAEWIDAADTDEADESPTETKR